MAENRPSGISSLVIYGIILVIVGIILIIFGLINYENYEMASGYVTQLPNGTTPQPITVSIFIFVAGAALLIAGCYNILKGYHK
jgi:uncharacterized membrane protein YidH (DUF202 family)